MGRYALHAVAVGLLALNAGCLARQVAWDGAAFHNAVADVYTQQAMNNLIRAYCNLPFVQLKFYQLNVTDSDDVSANSSVVQTVNTQRDLFLAAATRTLTNVYTLGGLFDRKRTMAVNADPVTDQNDIYLRYLAFARDPSLFVASAEPPACPVHLQRKCGTRYYWVPAEAGPAFLDLVLHTALMRGPETALPVPAAYEVKIVQVVDVNQAGRGDLTNATLVFDKPVPNGEATLVVDLDDGRRIHIPLWPVSTDADGKRVQLGQPTARLEIQWSPSKEGFTGNNLLNRPARTYSRDYPPEAPLPSPVLRQISTNVNQIKVNQFSGRP